MRAKVYIAIGIAIGLMLATLVCRGSQGTVYGQADVDRLKADARSRKLSK